MFDKKRVYQNISDAAGCTPLVKLNKSVAHLNADIYAKIEFMNPMGSVKDRVARYVIKKAIKEGRLKKGDTIIESSSGNTAMGLAMMAIEEGLHCKIVLRSSTVKEKLDVLRALGVELVLVDPDLPPEHPDSYNKTVNSILKAHPEYFFPDQHNNRENNESHYLSTGPEIWDQMEGKIDYVIAGIGTGGTLTGIAKYLKEQDENIKIIAIDPVGSVFYDYFKRGVLIDPSRYFIEGLGDEELIKCADFTLIDDIVQVSSEDAFKYTRKLVRNEAILAGGSSGAALFGVEKFIQELNPKKRIRVVTVFSDSGSKYLSTIFNDEWIHSLGYSI